MKVRARKPSSLDTPDGDKARAVRAWEVVLDADGTLLAGPPELRDIVRRIVLPGRSTSRLVRVIAGHLVSLRRVRDPARPWWVATVRRINGTGTGLSLRQREVAELAAGGYHCPEIASALGCATSTVRTHLRVIYDRLGVSSRAELARVWAEGDDVC